MSLFKTYTEEEIQLLKDHSLWKGTHSQLADSFITGLRYQKNKPIEFEDFVAQHDGLQLIMERYGLSVTLIKQSFEKEITSLVNLSEFSKRLEKL